MSIASLSFIRAAIAPALLTAGLTSLATAQPSKPDDLLNKTQTNRAIITQKVESSIREALAEARRLQPTSSVRAVNALKVALAQLDDRLIPEDFRNEWTTVLNTQIRQIQAGTKLAPPAEINPAKREIKEAELKRAKAIQEEYNDVRRSLNSVAALIKSGDSAQAQKEADALAKRYPNNPAALVMTENLDMNRRLADARILVGQQKEGFTVAMRSIDKSAVMPKDDIQFDPDRWKEITRLRNKSTLTKKEQQLMKALDSPINVGFKDAPFEEVIKFIANATGQEILLDKNSLMQANIESNTPVSITLRDVAARSVLRKVLQDHNLTYVIKNESIQIVTLDKAREMLVTRVYYLGDLVQGVGPLGNVRWNPALDMLQMQDMVNRLIDQIKALDPASWKDQGGNGSITFNWPSMALIIRQTTEFHAKFGGSAPH